MPRGDSEGAGSRGAVTKQESLIPIVVHRRAIHDRFLKPSRNRGVLFDMSQESETTVVRRSRRGFDDPDTTPHEPTPRRGWKPLRAIVSAVEWCLGVVCVLVGLAILAAIPILQFLSLGYLLEVGGRIARTGQLRDGFIGIRLAARLGTIALACWLFLLPVRFVSDLAYSASIIDPGSRAARNWRVGLIVLIVFTALHLITAVARGGRIRNFLNPLNCVLSLLRLKNASYRKSRDAVWEVLVSLRLPYYFLLGLKGFFAAFLWLLVPVTLLAISRGLFRGAPLLGAIGAFLLTLVVMYLPFLQMRLAETGRFTTAFEVGVVRRKFQRAPWMFAFSFFLTLLFALPLYLLKIEVIPSEAAWLPSLVFVAFIYPARFLVGWALARANRRAEPRHWFFRWTGRLTFLPVAAMYVLIVFFTQYTSWNGIASLYEQHAFLLPVPFLNL
jgi:hypothetical protein